MIEMDVFQAGLLVLGGVACRFGWSQLFAIFSLVAEVWVKTIP